MPASLPGGHSGRPIQGRRCTHGRCPSLLTVEAVEKGGLAFFSSFPVIAALPRPEEDRMGLFLRHLDLGGGYRPAATEERKPPGHYTVMAGFLFAATRGGYEGLAVIRKVSRTATRVPSIWKGIHLPYSPGRGVCVFAG